jgi:hypothetical protein
MNRSQVLGAAAAVVLIVSGAAVGRNSVQAKQVSNSDVLPALLVEVKGLRAAMEQMAGAGPRVQLSVGRLQLQETRMNGMIRRLDTVRDALASARRDVERFKGAMKMFDGEAHKPGDPPEEEPTAILAGMKAELTAGQATVDRLAAEEQQLANDLAIEQARWVDINQRLDELEKALAPRR